MVDAIGCHFSTARLVFILFVAIIQLEEDNRSKDCQEFFMIFQPHFNRLVSKFGSRLAKTSAPKDLSRAEISMSARYIG